MRDPKKISIEDEVTLAKARFLVQAKKLDPLFFVKRYPGTTLSCAFLAGLGAGLAEKKLEAITVLPLLLQTSRLLLRLFASNR